MCDELFPDLVAPSPYEIPTQVRKAILDGNSIRYASHPIKVDDKEIKGNTTLWVPGKGMFKRKIMVIAPCPTVEEDMPFKNEAAAKLQHVLSRYVGIDMVRDCYLTYLVKYTQPIDKIQQRAMDYCLPVLMEEIRLLKPDTIICLGASVFKTLTEVSADTDEFYGQIVMSKLTECKVGLVFYPTAIIKMPELQTGWVVDLRIMFNKYNPPCDTNWEVQDALPVWRVKNLGDWAEVLEKHAEISDFSPDTEFVEFQSWLTACMFKITIGTPIGTIDIHLYEPKQGYDPVFVPASVGRDKGREEVYISHTPDRMAFRSREEFESYISYNPNRKKAIHAYIAEYKWVYEGTEEELAHMLRALMCRPGCRIWGQNGRSDYKLFLKIGVNLLPYVVMDTITLAKCLDENQKLALESLSKRWLGAPSHKLELLQWLSGNKVLGGKLPYIFIPRKIIDPYAVTDSRRTFDLRNPLLAELERQHQEGKHAQEKFTIKHAYFTAKMPEFFALLQMELIGQPINPKTLVETMDWYADKRRKLLTECVAECKELSKNPNFNPDSPDDVAYLLFDVLRLVPAFSTDEEPWEDIPETERHLHTPSVSGETLDMLADKHPLVKKLNVCRMLGTLEKNYLRKGARWVTPPPLPKGESDVLTLSNEEVVKESTQTRATVERLIFGGMTVREYWEEKAGDFDSKSLSQTMENNGYIYVSYSELLETDRLATRPNISAITKNEGKDIAKAVGEAPPHLIRTVIEPHHNPMDLSKPFHILDFQIPKEKREWVLIESDWTTGEVWYLVVVADDPYGIAIMADTNRDVHASMARNMFPLDIPSTLTDMDIKNDPKWKTFRDAAKPFVFGIPYGRSAQALVRQLNLDAVKSGRAATYTKLEGEKFIQAYQQTFPKAWEYLQYQKQRVEYPRYLVSPWGFRRRFPETGDRAKLSAFQREASNWQIQHGLACVMMEATKAYMTQKRKHPKLPLYMIDILHDATKFICHSSAVDEAIELIHYTMGEGIRDKLPFEEKAKLRHTVEVYVSWCGELIKDTKQLERKEIQWDAVARVIPTAELAEQTLTSLNENQIHPDRSLYR